MAKKATAKTTQGVAKANQTESTNLPAMQKMEGSVLSEDALANIFSQPELFEGNGVSVTSNSLKKEDWEEMQGVEIDILFNGEMTTFTSEDTGKITDAAIFYSNFADGKTPVRYKGGQAMLAGGLKDGGKGLYKVSYEGDKKRAKGAGSFMSFSIIKKQSF